MNTKEIAMLSNEATALNIVESIGQKAWINQPSTSQRLHRFHGRTGVIIPNEDGESVFWFMPREAGLLSALCVVVDKLEVSIGARN